jgi:hypothetical protein
VRRRSMRKFTGLTTKKKSATATRTKVSTG